MATKKIVKPLKELMITLLDEGYEPDSDGDWILLDEYEIYDNIFGVEMFAYCGGEPDGLYTWKESWLKYKEDC